MPCAWQEEFSSKLFTEPLSWFACNAATDWTWLRERQAETSRKKKSVWNFCPPMPSPCANRRSATEMFSRSYKAAVTVPPLVWVTVFLLVPYLLMFCYSFWSVSPSQEIVHSWNFDNYQDLITKSLY